MANIEYLFPNPSFPRDGAQRPLAHCVWLQPSF
jgi:hypothetical protein